MSINRPLPDRLIQFGTRPAFEMSSERLQHQQSDMNTYRPTRPQISIPNSPYNCVVAVAPPDFIQPEPQTQPQPNINGVRTSSPKRWSMSGGGSISTSTTPSSDSSALLKQYTTFCEHLENCPTTLLRNYSVEEQAADNNAANTLASMRTSPIRPLPPLDSIATFGNTILPQPSINCAPSDHGSFKLPAPRLSSNYSSTHTSYEPRSMHPPLPRYEHDDQNSSSCEERNQSNYGIVTNVSRHTYNGGPIRDHVANDQASHARYHPYSRIIHDTSVSPKTKPAGLLDQGQSTENRSFTGLHTTYEASREVNTSCTTSPIPSRHNVEPMSGDTVCHTGGHSCINDNPRKCLSHFFGRNKSETKRIPKASWIWQCRKHYQRTRYSANREGRYWKVQTEMLREQLGKLESYLGDITWRIQWTSELEKKLRDFERSKHTGDSSSPGAEILAARRLDRFCGDDKCTNDVRNFVTEMDNLCTRSEVKDLLKVEFLPVRWTKPT